MRRAGVAIGLVFVLGAALGACSNSTGGGASTSGCGPLPAVMSQVPPNARSFPAPPGVAVIGVEHTDPYTEIIAVVQGGMAGVLEQYKQVLQQSGYNVTGTTKGKGFARLSYGGPSSEGTVALLPECPGRTDITVSVTAAPGPQ